ncbi:hypothetical protein [Rheinheimera nanhaiensis]|uniref:Lipoprotein n=1 Tax=Rheinheimera nanhaiensis E407-8 TaxID=562729 RepID=I1DVJ4_9GAMM|nr:hypothetical protein [Rheinheimera nanhaiensis]GAB58072.1 hypothetical protein RNAN_1043 [Rheinheimera nanhaiensis E407-8]
MRVLVKLALLALFPLLAACSDTPGERKLEQLLQQQFEQQHPGLVEIEQLEKLNGWTDSDTRYTAEVSYQISFNKSFKAYMDEQTQKPGNPLEKMASGMAVGLLKLQYGDFNAGDVYQVKQQNLQLRQTEKGWALAD